MRDNVYFIDGYQDSVEVIRLDGGVRRTAIEHVFLPLDVAVDVVGGALYVSDGSMIAEISRCDLDGRHCRRFVHKNIEKPFSVAIDYYSHPSEYS